MGAGMIDLGDGARLIQFMDEAKKFNMRGRKNSTHQ